MSLLKLVLIVGFAVNSLTAHANERSILAEGRIFESCEYFSSWEGEFSITYSNTHLPWGTTVELIYGFHGWTSDTQGQTQDWIETRTVPLTAISPYKWNILVVDQIAGRGTRWFDQMQFVLTSELSEESNA
jgi:GH18 family chitinase